MPGSGKSCAARELAAQLSCKWVDLDAEVERCAGKSIARIFDEDGETAFRNLESAVIRDISKQGSQIVSTGGGAVLRPENVTALRQNGRLFWLDRDPEALVPTDDRPLADTA